MSDIARKAVICIGLLAFSLSGIAGPLEAVICLGSNGHIAVEAPHDTCSAGSCHEDPDDEPATMVWATSRLAPRQDCPYCIDIPLFGGKTHFYTGGFGKGPFDCLPAPAHNSESLHAFAAPNQSIVFSQIPGPPATALDTIILLI